MAEFWKAAAIILISLILSLAIGRQEGDISVLLTLAAICTTAVLTVRYLEPVLDLLRQLESAGNLQEGLLDAVIKAVGIALTAELIALLCQDSGHSSLGKSIQLLGSAVILSLSIPLIQSLMSLFQEILGNL